MQKKNEVADENTPSIGAPAPAEEPKGLTLDQMIEDLRSQKHFVLMLGFMSDEKDEMGEPVIHYSYVREKLSLYSTEKVIQAFHQEFMKDAQKSMGVRAGQRPHGN